MKRLLLIMLWACSLVAISSAKDARRFVIAYVTSWSDVIPDPLAMTHINYAFGHVSETFDGIVIDNPERLKRIAALHEENKELNILLSVGGWGSGRFSEMVSCDSTRHRFCLDARRVIDEYGLDGIDIDWEYPGEPGGGISHAPTDVDNFSKLMNELRVVIGKDKLLTLATYAEGKFYKFTDFIDAVDFVNIMTYDMASAPGHHAPLFNSERFGGGSCEKGVRAHLQQDVPSEKICMGLPFYGRGLHGSDSNFVNYRDVGSMQDVRFMRDSVAAVPFLVDRNGRVVLGYDDKHSLANKCEYAKKMHLAGVMYWDYAGDDDSGTLRYAVRDAMLEDATPVVRAVVLAENGGQHASFTKAAVNWLEGFAKENSIEFELINDTEKITEEYLGKCDLFIQLDYPPYNWNPAAQRVFEDYLIEGRGGWIGFHHASLLGEFDGFGLWKFFSDFLGDIRFTNYVAETCDGEVIVEKTEHPVMQGISPRFTVTAEEWYTYDRSPRQDVHVLASVDENSYNSGTTVRMGDHPVVWVNEKIKSKNVYFQMGHSAELFANKDFVTMFGNAILWASGKGRWFPRFRALVVHNPSVEPAHRQFDMNAIDYFKDMAIGDGMMFKITSDFDDFDYDYLRTFDLVISLDDNPGHTKAQREAFEKYMENGGAWLGFHAAGFNIESTDWPWFLRFLGGGQFYRNNWPPLPAKIDIDVHDHDVTKGMPENYIAPANEWYQWKPSPRENLDVKVFASLSAENYPIGFKDEIPGGDTPVVWGNTRYNMIYMNYGHGPLNFTDATQNYLISNAIRWLVRKRYQPEK